MEREESLLIGKYRILQDDEEYRFTSDSVLLARFLRAKKGERVADFCAGSGIVGLHFFAENEGVEEVVLFEMQKSLSEMSARTVALNGLEEKFRAENMRVQDIPARYVEYFSLILCNPPYEKGGFSSANKKTAPCKRELTLTLPELAASAARCLKFGGRFALTERADRLAETVCALHERGLEPKKLQFIAGKEGAAPYAFLLSATKGGRQGMEILPALVNGRTV